MRKRPNRKFFVLMAASFGAAVVGGRGVPGVHPGGFRMRLAIRLFAMLIAVANAKRGTLSPANWEMSAKYSICN